MRTRTKRKLKRMTKRYRKWRKFTYKYTMTVIINENEVKQQSEYVKSQ